jgi:hypothetical protein
MASTAPFIPSAQPAPVTCTHCGQNATFVRATPDSKGRPYAYQLFECTGCHRRVMRTVGIDQTSDAEIQALAERIAGVPPRARPG